MRARGTRFRVIESSELVTQPIRDRMQGDLGLAIDFEMIDSSEGLQRVITRPDSFDLYHQWYTVDLMWTARCSQPIRRDLLTLGDEVLQAGRGRSGPSWIIDTVFDWLFVQKDGRFGPQPLDALSMLPFSRARGGGSGIDLFSRCGAVGQQGRAGYGNAPGQGVPGLACRSVPVGHLSR